VVAVRAFRNRRSLAGTVAVSVAVLLGALSFVWPFSDVARYSSAPLCTTIPESVTDTCRAVLPGKVLALTELRALGELVTVESAAGHHVARTTFTWSPPPLAVGAEVDVELWNGSITTLATSQGSVPTSDSPLARQFLLRQVAVLLGAIGAMLLIWSALRRLFGGQAWPRSEACGSPTAAQPRRSSSMVARDLAHTHPVLGLHAPAAEAAALIARPEIRAVLVTDDEQRLAGVLTDTTLLHNLLPPYLEASDSLVRVLDAEVTDELWRRLEGKQVADLLPVQEGLPMVRGDATLLEVGVVMLRKATPLVGVWDRGRLAGGISLPALLHELLTK
jgi:hypothetical protein